MPEEKKQMTIGDLLKRLPKFKKPKAIKTHIVSIIMSTIPWGAIWAPLLPIQAIGLIVMIVNFIIHKGNIFTDD